MKRLVAPAMCGMLLAGCGNAVTTDVNGATGVTVDDQGKPVVLVMVCHSTIDQIEISADREGLKETEENKILGTWTTSKAKKGLISLDLSAPGEEWKTESSFVPEASKGYIVIASQSDADVEATQASFHGRDLESLTPDEVIAFDGQVESRSAFEKTCDEDSGGGGY